MLASTSFLKEGNYNEYIEMLNKSNTDLIHYDVMDGNFVENKNLNKIEELEKYIQKSRKKIDVHLMTKKPKKYIEMLSKYEINNITIHKEIENYLEMIELIKKYNIKVGLAINPETNINDVINILPQLDLVLIMGVNPGKSGQTYIESTTAKLEKLRKIIGKYNLKTKIEIDGGVNDKVLPLIKKADIVVSASFVLDNLKNIDKIQKIN